jgi:hypothetical protein
VRKVFYDTNMSTADCLRCHADKQLHHRPADGPFMWTPNSSPGRSIRRAVSCSVSHGCYSFRGAFRSDYS